MIDAVIRDYVSSCIKKKVPDEAKKIQKRLETELNCILSDDEQEVLRVNQIIEEKGEIPDSYMAHWIVELSDVLYQRHFTTHVPKITHPDIDGIPGLIAYCSSCPDGYVRTGNVPFFLDSTGNAGALGATEFLSITVNGIPLYKHVLEDTEVAKQLYNYLGPEGQKVRTRFQSSLSVTSSSSTDARARQVYFPISCDDYAIITPLVSMPVMFRVKNIISDNQVYIRNPHNQDVKNPERAIDFEKKGQFLEGGYWNIPGLVDIKFGGTKPQNISSINSKAKNFKLLRSMPPELRRRKARIPQKDFFSECIYLRNEDYKDKFIKLDKLMKEDRNNIRIRDQRDAYILSLMEEVAFDIASVRQEISQLEQEYKGGLDFAQYQMLYEDEKRYEDTVWLDVICDQFARWFFDAYRKVVSNPVSLGQDEFIYVKSFALNNMGVFIQ